MKWIPIISMVVLGFVDQIPGCGGGQAPPPPPQTNNATAGADTGAAPTPDAEPQAPPEDANAAFKKPLLWVVTKEGQLGTNYLFGALDAPMKVEFERCPQSVQNAMNGVERAVFETATGSAAERERTKLMAMKTGSLRKELGAKKLKQLVEITEEKSSILNYMKPWVVHLVMDEKIAGQPPMDESFEQFAEAYRKRISPLETVPEQVRVLEEHVNFEVIGKMADEHEEMLKLGTDAANAYREGDAQAIWATTMPEGKARTQLHQKLIEARVPVWAGKLATHFEQDSTLAVVSARYLIGKPNLVDALKEQGWKVERVKH